MNEQISYSVLNTGNSSSLRGYQKEAANGLLVRAGEVLAHPTGSGKSLTLLETAISAKELGLYKKPIILAQQNTITNFQQELAEHFPSKKGLFFTARNSPKARKEYWQKFIAGDYDVAMVPHTVFDALNCDYQSTQLSQEDKSLLLEKWRPDAKSIEDLRIDFVLIDEADRYNNGLTYGPSLPSTQGLTLRAKADVIYGQGGLVVGATATPIRNNESDKAYWIALNNKNINKFAEMAILLDKNEQDKLTNNLPTATNHLVLVDDKASAEVQRAAYQNAQSGNIQNLTNARKAAFDPRLIDSSLNPAVTKIDAVSEKVLELYNKDEKGVQLIFFDIGQHEINGVNLRKELKEKLVADGVNPNEIADFTESKNTEELQAGLNSGKYRVAIGSSQRMGTGINVQKNVIAMHNMDQPWTPAAFTQRYGRGIRSGNENKQVDVYHYSAANSYDEMVWRLLRKKSKMIDTELGKQGQNALRNLKFKYKNKNVELERIPDLLNQQAKSKNNSFSVANEIVLKKAADAIKKQITLNKGKLAWVKPWSACSAITNQNGVSGHIYRGVNEFLLALITPDPTEHRWFTYKQINDKGWSLQKGSRGVPIAVFAKKTIDEENLEDEKEKTKKTKTFFFKKHVFNGSQIVGIDPPPPPPLPTWENVKKIEDDIKKLGVNIVEHGADAAYYMPLRDEIRVPHRSGFKSKADYYATVLHEIAHWTGHKSRTDRKSRIKALTNKTDYEKTAREEIIAEMAAFTLTQKYGLAFEPKRTAAYIESWAKRDPEGLEHCLKEVLKVINYIEDNTAEKAAETISYSIYDLGGSGNGYNHNRGMSNNAVDAYTQGIKPLSRISKVDLEAAGVPANISLDFAKWFAKNGHWEESEWHHPADGGFFNKTNFYDPEELAEIINDAQTYELDINALQKEYKIEQQKLVNQYVRGRYNLPVEHDMYFMADKPLSHYHETAVKEGRISYSITNNEIRKNDIVFMPDMPGFENATRTTIPNSDITGVVARVEDRNVFGDLRVGYQNQNKEYRTKLVAPRTLKSNTFYRITPDEKRTGQVLCDLNEIGAGLTGFDYRKVGGFSGNTGVERASMSFSVGTNTGLALGAGAIGGSAGLIADQLGQLWQQHKDTLISPLEKGFRNLSETVAHLRGNSEITAAAQTFNQAHTEFHTTSAIDIGIPAPVIDKSLGERVGEGIDQSIAKATKISNAAIDKWNELDFDETTSKLVDKATKATEQTGEKINEVSAIIQSYLPENTFEIAEKLSNFNFQIAEPVTKEDLRDLRQQAHLGMQQQQQELAEQEKKTRDSLIQHAAQIAEEITGKVNPAVSVKVVDEIIASGDAALASGATSELVTANGVYEHQANKISLSVNALKRMGLGAYEKTVWHEAMHSVEKNIPLRERQQLIQAMPGTGLFTKVSTQLNINIPEEKLQDYISDYVKFAVFNARPKLLTEGECEKIRQNLTSITTDKQLLQSINYSPAKLMDAFRDEKEVMDHAERVAYTFQEYAYAKARNQSLTKPKTTSQIIFDTIITLVADVVITLTLTNPESTKDQVKDVFNRAMSSQFSDYQKLETKKEADRITYSQGVIAPGAKELEEEINHAVLQGAAGNPEIPITTETLAKAQQRLQAKKQQYSLNPALDSYVNDNRNDNRITRPDSNTPQPELSASHWADQLVASNKTEQSDEHAEDAALIELKDHGLQLVAATTNKAKNELNKQLQINGYLANQINKIQLGNEEIIPTKDGYVLQVKNGKPTVYNNASFLAYLSTQPKTPQSKQLIDLFASYTGEFSKMLLTPELAERLDVIKETALAVARKIDPDFDPKYRDKVYGLDRQQPVNGLYFAMNDQAMISEQLAGDDPRTRVYKALYNGIAPDLTQKEKDFLTKLASKHQLPGRTREERYANALHLLSTTNVVQRNITTPIAKGISKAAEVTISRPVQKLASHLSYCSRAITDALTPTRWKIAKAAKRRQRFTVDEEYNIKFAYDLIKRANPDAQHALSHLASVAKINAKHTLSGQELVDYALKSGCSKSDFALALSKMGMKAQANLADLDQLPVPSPQSQKIDNNNKADQPKPWQLSFKQFQELYGRALKVNGDHYSFNGLDVPIKVISHPTKRAALWTIYQNIVYAAERQGRYIPQKVKKNVNQVAYVTKEGINNDDKGTKQRDNLPAINFSVMDYKKSLISKPWQLSLKDFTTANKSDVRVGTAGTRFSDVSIPSKVTADALLLAVYKEFVKQAHKDGTYVPKENLIIADITEQPKTQYSASMPAKQRDKVQEGKGIQGLYYLLRNKEDKHLTTLLNPLSPVVNMVGETELVTPIECINELKPLSISKANKIFMDYFNVEYANHSTLGDKEVVLNDIVSRHPRCVLANLWNNIIKSAEKDGYNAIQYDNGEMYIEPKNRIFASKNLITQALKEKHINTYQLQHLEQGKTNDIVFQKAWLNLKSLQEEPKQLAIISDQKTAECSFQVMAKSIADNRDDNDTVLATTLSNADKNDQLFSTMPVVQEMLQEQGKKYLSFVGKDNIKYTLLPPNEVVIVPHEAAYNKNQHYQKTYNSLTMPKSQERIITFDPRSYNIAKTYPEAEYYYSPRGNQYLLDSNLDQNKKLISFLEINNMIQPKASGGKVMLYLSPEDDVASKKDLIQYDSNNRPYINEHDRTNFPGLYGKEGAMRCYLNCKKYQENISEFNKLFRKNKKEIIEIFAKNLRASGVKLPEKRAKSSQEYGMER